MNHKDKIKLARRMAGRKNRTGIFLTEAWEKRKEAIKKRVKKLQVTKKK